MWENVCSVAFSSFHSSTSVSTLWSTGGELVGIFIYQSLSALLHLDNLLPPGSLEVNTCNYSWQFQVIYVFSLPVLVPVVLSKCLAEHVTCLIRLLIFMTPCWMEALWLSTALIMLKDVSFLYPTVKDLIRIF